MNQREALMAAFRVQQTKVISDEIISDPIEDVSTPPHASLILDFKDEDKMEGIEVSSSPSSSPIVPLPNIFQVRQTPKIVERPTAALQLKDTTNTSSKRKLSLSSKKGSPVKKRRIDDSQLLARSTSITDLVPTPDKENMSQAHQNLTLTDAFTRAGYGIIQQEDHAYKICLTKRGEIVRLSKDMHSPSESKHITYEYKKNEQSFISVVIKTDLKELKTKLNDFTDRYEKIKENNKRNIDFVLLIHLEPEIANPERKLAEILWETKKEILPQKFMFFSSHSGLSKIYTLDELSKILEKKQLPTFFKVNINSSIESFEKLMEEENTYLVSNRFYSAFSQKWEGDFSKEFLPIEFSQLNNYWFTMDRKLEVILNNLKLLSENSLVHGLRDQILEKRKEIKENLDQLRGIRAQYLGDEQKEKTLDKNKKMIREYLKNNSDIKKLAEDDFILLACMNNTPEVGKINPIFPKSIRAASEAVSIKLEENLKLGKKKLLSLSVY